MYLSLTYPFFLSRESIRQQHLHECADIRSRNTAAIDIGTDAVGAAAGDQTVDEKLHILTITQAVEVQVTRQRAGASGAGPEAAQECERAAGHRGAGVGLADGAAQRECASGAEHC